MRVTLLRSAGTGNRGTKRAACAAPADMEDASLHDMQAVSNYIGTERHLSNMTCDGRPATAMLVDFHLDNKFNTSITKCIQHCLGLHLSGIYIWAVTGSSFLAVVGMSEILLSIPCAWFPYARHLPGQVLRRYEHDVYLHCVCHWRHDIFVFIDAYVQSQFKGPNVNRDMETRFSWV